MGGASSTDGLALTWCGRRRCTTKALDGSPRAWQDPPVPASLVGRVLGSYRIERVLGQGGMGAVYVGRHARTGRAYAIKVLLAAHAGQTDALKRFRREADALGAVGHAHIVAIHDYDETPDGLWFLVMDLLEGEDLAHRLSRRGPLPYREAIALLDPISSAIQAAHRVGLIHRDLKPSNIFLARMPGEEIERPMLLDFGLARALDERPGEASKVTATGTVLGTPSYMSPEQAQGQALDGRSDLWALAVILFELISGRPPFDGPTLTSILVAVLTSPRPHLRDRGVDVPDALEQVLDRALAKTPAERYPDVGAFRDALAQIAGLVRRTEPPTSLAVAPTQAMTTQPGPAPTPSARPPAISGGELYAATLAAPSAVVPVTAVVPRAGASAGGRPTAWIATALIASFLVFGGGAVALAMVLFGRSFAAPAVARSVSSPPVLTDGAHHPSPATSDAALDAAVDARTDARTDTTAEPLLVAEAEGDPSAEGERREIPAARRDRLVRARSSAPVEAPIEASPPSGAPAVDEAPMTGPPPALVRATERMGEGDFAGCLRELEHAGHSAPILGARMNCALRTGRRSDLEEACALLHQHHPRNAYTTTCDTLLGVTP
jgi:serine/threonine-protein kinase